MLASSDLDREFYERPVEEVARDLIGCTIAHGGASGVIVETEGYHESEPACHAYVGQTVRNEVLFGPAGHVYVYRSYGIHSLVNFVTGPEGEGAAVLIRALEPCDGIDLMRERRGVERVEDLCSGPGKLTEALAIGLGLNGTDIENGSLEVTGRASEPAVVTAPRIGISKAVELPWRFCSAGSRFVSRPRPAV